MSGIAVFVPDQEMYGQVEEILKEKEYHVKVLKVIETEEAVYEARKAISEQGIISLWPGESSWPIYAGTQMWLSRRYR